MMMAAWNSDWPWRSRDSQLKGDDRDREGVKEGDGRLDKHYMERVMPWERTINEA